MIGPAEIGLAFLLDAAMGDPAWLPHPVRLIGRLIARLETLLRARMKNLRLAGQLLTATVVSAVFLAGVLISWGAAMAGAGASFVAAAGLVYLAATTISLRELGLRVRDVLRAEDLPAARSLLRHIVGRDTGSLDADGVRRAAIETLAENTSDGVVAPLFYLALGGLPLALAYKAVNTLDSMVGYKNEKYADLGRASAKLDDAMNYIPARLTGWLIAMGAWLFDGFRPGRAARALGIMRRDGRKHASPNSGVPEAAMAGALDVVLGGPSVYFGAVVEKPFIGEGAASDLEGAAGAALAIALTAAVLALLLSLALATVRAAVLEGGHAPWR